LKTGCIIGALGWHSLTSPTASRVQPVKAGSSPHRSGGEEPAAVYWIRFFVPVYFIAFTHEVWIFYISIRELALTLLRLYKRIIRTRDCMRTIDTRSGRRFLVEGGEGGDKIYSDKK
jgi:hypothetical protein